MLIISKVNLLNANKRSANESIATYQSASPLAASIKLI